MSYVPGQVLRTPADAAGLAAGDLTAIAYGLFDVLAPIHAVDLDATGLAALARSGSYAGRQLRRWYRQWQEIRVRDLPLLDELHAELAARVPDQPGVSLIHGDYRLDNVILDPARPGSAQISAVLDWELATVGDPLADLGLALAYWTQPEEAGQLPPAPTDAPGLPRPPRSRGPVPRAQRPAGRRPEFLRGPGALEGGLHGRRCLHPAPVRGHGDVRGGHGPAPAPARDARPGRAAGARWRTIGGAGTRRAAGGDRMTDTVRFEVSGPVATITLNRPDRLNAMTEELIGGVLASWSR